MKPRRIVAFVIATALLAAGALAQQSAPSSGSQSGAPATGSGVTVGVKLDGDAGTFTVVTKQPDGTLVRKSVTGSQKAADAVSTGGSAAHETEGGALDVR